MKASPIRVIKLGGSLLAWPLWQGAIRSWLLGQPIGRNRIVVGGGRPVDELRKLDATVGLGQLACHRIAIHWMGINARLVAQQMGAEFGANCRSVVSIVDVEKLIEDRHFEKQAGVKLPSHWQVTSDSIAAFIARGLGAQELVLLKSCEPPGSCPQQWNEAGFVDACFENVVAGISCRAVNLRAVPLPDGPSLSN